jgi:hypothetical protein
MHFPSEIILWKKDSFLAKLTNLFIKCAGEVARALQQPVTLRARDALLTGPGFSSLYFPLVAGGLSTLPAPGTWSCCPKKTGISS